MSEIKAKTCTSTANAAAAFSPAAPRSVLLLVVFAVAVLLSLAYAAKPAQAQNAPPMVVGIPTVDANGVKYYPVISVYQGLQQQIVRVLEPTNPAPGKPRRILYVLPVDQGVDTTSSAWSDGLEELRLLDVQNRFNMTLIAPSFNYEPWYGDNVSDPAYRMESFIIDDLVPFGDKFAHGSVPQRYLIGFSKSGTGVLSLILRHPGVFNAAAAWDAPAQLSDLSAFSALPMNFGTQANFSLYNIPSLVQSNGQAFLQQNRLWISGDQAAWTDQMIQLNNQLNTAGIPHTWVQGPVRVHSWNSGWLNGAAMDLDANATVTAPSGGVLPPPRTGGWPAGTLPIGSTQASLSVRTDDAATCRYSSTAGVAYNSMTNTFATTGGTLHSTVVTGLQSSGNYHYYIRCQDNASGLTNADDYIISFSVPMGSTGATASSTFSGTEDPLTEKGMWSTAGSWANLKKNNGAYTTSTTAAARLVSPVTGPNQFAEITYDQDPGTASWPGVMTRVQSTTGSGYLAIAYAGEVQLYRTDDRGGLIFSQLASAPASVGTAPRRLRLESQGSTHNVYLNGVLLITYTDPNNTYATGQPGIADAIFGGPTVKILTFSGGALTTGGGGDTTDTTPPVRSAGLPSGTLASGTTQTTLSLTTNEAASCRYATNAGVAYGSMTNTFSTTGGTAHSTAVSGLQDGLSYSYSVRCQDTAGNPNTDDYTISFTVAASSGGSGTTATSTFPGVETTLSESGLWSRAGSWSALSKNNGAYTVNTTGGARLTSPTSGADQFAEITYDQDPGTASWPGVMTRVQSATNGSGYLAIAYAGEVRLYRTDDNGSSPGFTQLASATASVGTAPRRLRLESQGSTHRVYFNGTLLITYTDTSNVYRTGQPGIAAAIFGGPTVKILTFSGGALTTP
jgi:hypothetical protein